MPSRSSRVETDTDASPPGPHTHATGLQARTRSGVEVDFVLYGPNTMAAIEVKNAARVRSEDLRGLRAFAEDYPQSRRVLLYRGRERLKIGEILCMPCDEFLLALHPAEDLPL